MLTADQRRRLRTFLYLWLLLALFTLLVTATYTWFTLSRTPRVSDMELHINTPSGLEIAEQPVDSEWGQVLNFYDLVPESAPLRPITWSSAQNRFLAARYGFDGRISGWQPLSDTQNSNRDDAEGYYILGTFYARTDQPGTVSLAEAVELNNGVHGAGTYVIGTPIWDTEGISHTNGGFGAECAIRIAFSVSYLHLDGTPDETQESLFYIYEPNCDKHLEGPDGYVETKNVDNDGPLLDPERLILQTASTWEESYPVQHNVTVKTLGSFTTDRELFSLTTDQLAKIQVYIWLEGQDVDCSNVMEEARIFANIQFAVDYKGQSGLDEIDNSTPTNPNNP